MDLDTALKDFATFPNGCNFRLLSRNGGEYHELDYGCYGVHVNLCRKGERYMMNMLGRRGENGPVRLNNVNPEVIVELLARKPCEQCGGFLFETRKDAP